jgi:hypothetical protein
MKRLEAIQKEMEEMVDRINDDTEFNKTIDKLIEEDKELMKNLQQEEAKEKLEEALSKFLNETGWDD